LRSSRRIMKLFTQVSVFGAVLALATALASAETIQLGSYQTGGPNLGNNNTAVAFVGSATTTYALDPGTVWAPAGPKSVWVSNNPGSGPGGSVVKAAGNYSYTATFTTQAGNIYSGFVWVLADDTTSILFNDHVITPAGALGTDVHCGDGTPNCSIPTLVNLPSAFFLTGINTLQFDLQQTIASAGLDFYGSVTGVIGSTSSVPEPGTLFLLGSGLIGSAGLLMRKSKSNSTSIDA
jgi:hypothetical protein